MIAKKKIIWVFLFFSMVFLIPSAYAIPGTWRGYVRIAGSLAADGTAITAYIGNSTLGGSTTVGSVATWPDGYYLINVEGTSSDKVNFKICNVYADLPAQDWSYGLHPNSTSGSPYINISIPSACPTTTTTTAPSGGGGGGGVSATTTTTTSTTTTTTTTPTTTTTTLPAVEEVQTVETIEAGETGTFTYVESTIELTQIKVEVKDSINNVQITVSQSPTKPATIAIAAPHTVYGYYTVEKQNVVDDDVKSATIEFKVKKSWVAEQSIDESTVALQRFEGGTWSRLPTAKLREDATYIYFEATTTALSVFAVTAERVVTTTTVPTTTTTTLPTVPLGGPVVLIVVVVMVMSVAVFILWKKKD